MISRIGTLGEAGKIAGVSDEQLARWRDGLSKPNLFGVTKLAEAAGYSVGWLANGEEAAPNAAVSAGEDAISIPKLDVLASAGAGVSGHSERPVEMIRFPRAWLRSVGISANNARILTVSGDSMEPTLSSGDLLLVDVSINKIKGDAIYVLVMDDEVYVKRALPRMSGAILITSDNDRYPAEEVSEETAKRLQVAGRVVWYGRSI